ncbi:ATP-binding protein [Kitasatospora acidiphila]|uniref:ATP-binding protein n=1 Tax=Kitasatospora acidiphila TaxID=2567942 RepID=A0A540W3Z9_9ACTN|nr:ATP-binding protein [Kitasatospora acidiphila]TQF03074.1 ATP-binding protein [Kitasatospora acidiphila]
MTTDFTLADQPDPMSQVKWQLPATPLGARRARLNAVQQVCAWGWKPESHLVECVTLIVAELASNAITHGRRRGLGFQLRLSLDSFAGLPKLLRIEVTDPRGERLPCQKSGDASADGESGRGLLIVDTLADRWGTVPYPPYGKTLWCELDLGG